MLLRSSSLLLPCVLLASLPAVAKIKVVTTSAPLAALARDVGGLDVEVESLLARHLDPHTATPTPEMVAALAGADLLIENGLGLEAGWLPSVKAQVKNPKFAAAGNAVLDASTLVDKLEAPAAGAEAGAGSHALGNPHYLIDPARAAKVALGIAERLGALEPKVAAKIRERASFIAAKLEETARITRAEISRKIPAERRRVAESHRSLAYLADTLGLEVVAVAELRPGVPLDPARIAEVAPQLKASGASTVVALAVQPRAASRSLAKAAGVRLTTLPDGPNIEVGDTFLTYIERTTSALITGMSTRDLTPRSSPPAGDETPAR